MQPLPRLALALLSTMLLACDAADDPGTAEHDARAERAARFTNHRALAEAHLEVGVDERLAADGQVLVDPMATALGEQTRYVLLRGSLAAVPADIEALLADPAIGGQLLYSTMHGGEDSAHPAIFDDIVAGLYTVCMATSAPAGPGQAEFLARAAAAYEADSGGDLTAEKLRAAAAQAQQETGYEPQRIDWRARPLRCRSFAVTTAASSRVVELE